MILSEEHELETNSSAQSKNKTFTFDFQSQIYSICYNRIHFAEQKWQKKTKERRNENRQKKQLRKEGTKTEAKLYFGWKWIIDVKSI